MLQVPKINLSVAKSDLLKFIRNVPQEDVRVETGEILPIHVSAVQQPLLHED